MDKEMSYVIDKVIRKRYEVTDIGQFLKFSTFHNARKGMRFTPCTCFCCNHKFTDDEYTYLGIVKGDKNRIFCKDCAERIAKKLGKESITKLTKD